MLKRAWLERKIVSLAVLLLVNLLIWSVVWQEDKRGELTVAFLNVGQGDAILIESPSGNQVLIDGGPNRSVLGELGKILPWYDRSLDLIIASHPDADHIGGLPAVLARYEVSGFMAPGITSDTATYRAFEKAVNDEGAKKVLARRGLKIILGRGAELAILFPDDAGEQSAKNKKDTNAASIVAKLTYGQQSFLLTGDAPIATERFLMSVNRPELDVVVLKLGHHGSRTSSAPEFLQAASPDYAVISAGQNNRYGHPHAEVLQTLADQKIPALQTAERGTIIFTTDGTTLTLK